MDSDNCYNMSPIVRLILLLSFFLSVEGSGLLILYRPNDVSNECAFSRHLRYDLTFGMGMSDTITLVFRTLNPADYECMVEIVAAGSDMYLVIVILYPNNVGINCLHNRNAIAVLKQDLCINLCDTIKGKTNENTPYFVAGIKERFRFRFASNSSINADMSAHMYQVTATVARLKPHNQKCCAMNESICSVNYEDYCFTSGVVCDGIKNCGVEDWFDERPAECSLPVERLGFAPVFAVSTAILCTALAAGHLLMRCLPPLANSFFVFNANEDNRLYVDTVFEANNEDRIEIEHVHRPSIVPVQVSSSSTSDSKQYEDTNIPIEKANEKGNLGVLVIYIFYAMEKTNEHTGHLMESQSQRKVTAVRMMTAKLQQKFWAVTGRGQAPPAPPPSSCAALPINDSFDI